MGNVVEIGIGAIAQASRGARLLGAVRVRTGKGMLSIADQIVASATTFLTGAVIGRLCDKEEFGLYTLGFSLLALLMAIQASLITTPLSINTPRLQGMALRTFSGSSLVHQSIFGVAASLLTLCAGAVASFWDASLATLLAATGAMLAFLLLRDYMRQSCFARMAFAQALAADVILAIIQLGGLAALVMMARLSAVSAFLVLGGASAITASFWIFRTRAERIIDRHEVQKDFSRTWSDGKWILASGLLWALSMNLYAWIIAAFHGTATTGVWAAAFGVMTLINPLMLGIQNYLGPRIMHAIPDGGIPELRRVVCHSSLAFSVPLAIFSFAMWFFGDALISSIYGAKYAGNGGLVFVLALNATVLTLGFTTSRGLFALELASLDFYVNLVAFVCFLLFGILLVRSAGPLGAAIAQVVTNGVATTIRAAAFVRASKRLATQPC